MRWGPTKSKTRIKVIECGRGRWDCEDHGLDYPDCIDTIDFKVTGTGHERIEHIYRDWGDLSLSVSGYPRRSAQEVVTEVLGKKAQETLELANRVTNPDQKTYILKVAERYEQLAVEAEGSTTD